MCAIGTVLQSGGQSPSHNRGFEKKTKPLCTTVPSCLMILPLPFCISMVPVSLLKCFTVHVHVHVQTNSGIQVVNRYRISHEEF